MTNSQLLSETPRHRKLYVGLSRARDPKKFGSAIIRFSETPKSILEPRSWFKMYKASHVFLAYPAHPARDFYLVNEAVGSGIRFTSEKYFEDHAKIVGLYLFYLTDEVYRKVKNYGAKMQGAPYPFLENVGIGLQRIAKWFLRRDIDNPFDEGDKAIKCSELFFRALLEQFSELDFASIRADLLNENGEWLSGDIDSLGVRDTELVLEWLVTKNYCARAETIEPVQNSSALMAG